MKLTAERAVGLSIELWTWLAETGERKSNWPEWKVNGGQYARVDAHCFLCEYARSNCEACPYSSQYSACYDSYGKTPGPYEMWAQAIPQEDRKKYAKKFLNQLKKILKGMEEK